MCKHCIIGVYHSTCMWLMYNHDTVTKSLIVVFPAPNCLTLVEGLILNSSIHVVAATTVTFYIHDSLNLLDNPQSLKILKELFNVGVIMSASPLSLASKKLFQRILTNSLAQEGINTRQGKQVPNQLNK